MIEKHYTRDKAASVTTATAIMTSSTLNIYHDHQ